MKSVACYAAVVLSSVVFLGCNFIDAPSTDSDQTLTMVGSIPFEMQDSWAMSAGVLDSSEKVHTLVMECSPTGGNSFDYEIRFIDHADAARRGGFSFDDEGRVVSGIENSIDWPNEVEGASPILLVIRASLGPGSMTASLRLDP